MVTATAKAKAKAKATQETKISGVSLFCKVCFDAEKPKSVYTSHHIRDLNQQVICPTLLSLLCRHCDQRGHTIRYCPFVVAQEEEKEKEKHKQDQDQTKDQDITKATKTIGSATKVFTKVFTKVIQRPQLELDLDEFPQLPKPVSKPKSKSTPHDDHTNILFHNAFLFRDMILHRPV